MMLHDKMEADKALKVDMIPVAHKPTKRLFVSTYFKSLTANEKALYLDISSLS